MLISGIGSIGSDRAEQCGTGMSRLVQVVPVEQVVVAGRNVPVVEVEGGPGVNQKLPDEVVAAALIDSGYAADEVVEMATALAENGYLKPLAWANVVRQELIESGVAHGAVDAVVSTFQTVCIQLCGTEFVRLMGGRSEKTDAEVAAAILRGKHVPAAPVVKEETGWAPQVEVWREYVLGLAAWIGTIDPELAMAVRQILSDWEVDPSTLKVGRQTVRSFALGSVLRGSNGIGQMTRLVSDAPMEVGCGLWML